MTATAAPVDRSTRRLSEAARHVVIPEGIVDSLWYDVAERCEEFGDQFDAWQDGLGEVTLGIREDGSFAATVGGVTFSIPRQVAKTFIVMRIVVALCTLFPNLTVIWTAHRMRTATNTFQKMKSYVLRQRVRPYIKAGSNNGTAIRDANGEQEIPFVNGSRIIFGAREQGFGRGFDEVDIEVFDEAQILTVKALEDMVAATNQSRFEHGALLFYMGTPPRPGVDPGDVFTQRRKDALTSKASAGGDDFGAPVEAGDSVYVECSGDPQLDVDDPRQVELANPSYPHRTPPVSVQRLRKNLPDRDSWRREGLGIWDETAGGLAFGPGKWEACAGPEPEGVALLAIGVAVSMDLTRSAIVGAGVDKDGVTHVRPLQHGPGTSWVVGRAAELQERHSAPVVIDGRGPGAVLIPELEAVLGDRLTVASTANVLDACAGIFGRVQERELRHGSYPELDAAVAAAKHRDVQDRWAWGRKASTADISTLEAATLADWAANGQDTTSVYETRGLVTL